MSKSNNVPLNHAPSGFGGVDVNVEGFVDVNTPLVGKSIIDGLWGKFSTSSQLQQGDFLMDRSRNLLRRHLHLIEVNDQDTIRKKIDELVDYLCHNRWINSGVTVCETSETAWKAPAGPGSKGYVKPGSIDNALRWHSGSSR